jgi:hypothetical protein
LVGLSGLASAEEPDRAPPREPDEAWYASSGEQFVADGAVPAFGIQVSQGRGVEVTGPGRTQTRRNRPILDLGLSYGHTWGSSDTTITQNGNLRRGEAIDISTPTLRLDGRLRFAGIGNLGNLGNIANAGNLGPSDCFFGVQGAIGLDDGDTGLKTDQHGAGGAVDTFLRREFRYAVTPYVGCSVARFGNLGSDIKVMAGPRFTSLKYTFDTDESQGSAAPNQRVERTETSIGPALGIEYNHQMDPKYYGGIQGGLRIGGWVERVSGTDFRFTSTPNNITYDVQSDTSWNYTVRGGVFLNF